MGFEYCYIMAKKVIDMENCKGCGSTKLTKNGKNKLGAQRYRCKECGGTFIEGDNRLKHGLEKRLKVINMYLEGVGIRSIERLEKVSNPLIIYWIRHFSGLIRKELRRRPIPDQPKDIAIVEIDELFTYYKKRPSEHMYGLLLTETETKLLISK
jgi:transposase